MLWRKGNREAWSNNEDMLEPPADTGDGSDDGEGLPPMAEGSRWIGGCRVTSAEAFPITGMCMGGELASHVTVACLGDAMALHIGGMTVGTSIADVRHAIASHDRANGCHPPDLVKALAGELLNEANMNALDAVHYSGESAEGRFRTAEATARDAAHRILAVLDELKSKGVW